MLSSNLLSVDVRGAVGGSPGGPHSHSGDGCADKRELEAVDNPLEQLNITNFLNSIGLDQLKVKITHHTKRRKKFIKSSVLNLVH